MDVNCKNPGLHELRASSRFRIFFQIKKKFKRRNLKQSFFLNAILDFNTYVLVTTSTFTVTKSKETFTPLVSLLESCLKYFMKRTKRTAVWSRVLACWAQTCRCTSSGCTICAVRRRRYARSGRNAAGAARAVNLGPIIRTSPNRRLDPCSVATGYIGARANSSSGPLCSPATHSTKLPFRYRGKVFFIFARFYFSLSLSLAKLSCPLCLLPFRQHPSGTASRFMQ